MPQMNKGEKFIFGKSLIRPDGPPQIDSRLQNQMISYNDQYDKNKDLIEKRDGIMIKLSREKEHEQEVTECQAI